MASRTSQPDTARRTSQLRCLPIAEFALSHGNTPCGHNILIGPRLEVDRTVDAVFFSQKYGVDRMREARPFVRSGVAVNANRRNYRDALQSDKKGQPRAWARMLCGVSGMIEQFARESRSLIR
jgi:hypothetical protein